MNIKELLLEGCSINMPYKTKKEEWVGNVMIHILEGGFGMKPKVIITGNIGHHDFDVEMLDLAIEFFKTKVLCPENLWYKHNEAMRVISKANPDIDLEEEEDFEMYERVRLELVSKAKK
jgi:hypothetical protein